MSGTKPPFKIPSMKEIEEIPWNGFKVVSTFSGGGGSCLGYRMAGYHVVWANEFVEEAQRTYRANHKDTFLNCKDIRDITPEDVLRETGLKAGEIDIFDGSPPCCAFSTCGKREKGWGKERKYSDGKKQSIEDLFEEYIRLLNGLQPKTFVAENVSGMVKGSAIGYFKKYLQEMRQCGYTVEARVVKAMWLGVPQRRERLIFVGVRNDLCMSPVYPAPYPYTYSIKDALEGLEIDQAEREFLLEDAKKQTWGKIADRIPINPDKSWNGADIEGPGHAFNLKRDPYNKPVSTITQSSGNLGIYGVIHPLENRKFTVGEAKRLTTIPDDFILTGSYSQQVERLGRMVPPVMMMNIAKTIEKEILDKAKAC